MSLESFMESSNDKLKVFVLGHNGMLGSMLASYLRSEGHLVATSDERYTGDPSDRLLQDVARSDGTWIVNAIGLVKQKSANYKDLFVINSILPQHLLHSMRQDQKLIHPSTDCVFSGDRGWYRESEQVDPDDVYGLSKYLGEAVKNDSRVTVIRTSIIGPEINSKFGLFSWFLAQPLSVNGYTNHVWNGVTTLEWSKMFIDIAQRRIVLKNNLVHAGTEVATSKYQILCEIKKIWKLKTEINPDGTKPAIDRSLMPSVVRKSLTDQLIEMESVIRNKS
jgi:dTDP-4-dehydrorhamnose reductase